MGPYFAIAGFTLAVLITWTVVGPIKYTTMVLVDENLSQGTCNFWSGEGVVFAYTIIGLVLVVQTTLLILACKIKNINEEIGDSRRYFRYKVFACANSLFWVGIISILAMKKDAWELKDWVVALTGSVLVICLLGVKSVALMGFFIAPRMYYVWYERKYGHLPENVVLMGRGNTMVRVNETETTIRVDNDAVSSPISDTGP